MRILISPSDVRGAGQAFVARSDDLARAATRVRGVALPEMPIAVAATVTSHLEVAAQRLGMAAEEYARVGEELQFRAAAAGLADAGAPDAALHGGSRLRDALAAGGAISARGPGGRLVVGTASVGSDGTVVTAGGLRFTIPELRVGAAAGDPDALSDASDSGDDSRDGGDWAPGGEPAVASAQRHGDQVDGEITPSAAAPSAPGPVLAEPTSGPPAVVTAEALRGDGAREPLHPLARAALGHPDDAADRPHHVGDTTRELLQPAPGHPPPAHETDQQKWACWMAARSAHAGVPHMLPLMIALACSGLRNVQGAGDAVGFFDLKAGITHAPRGHGEPPDAAPGAQWWIDRPGAQLDHVLRELRDTGGGIRTGTLADADALARWAAHAHPEMAAEDYAAAHAAANELAAQCGGGRPSTADTAAPVVGNAATSPTPAEPSGDEVVALAAARSQLGVHEAGVNTGPQVDRYLASARVAPGNPWCASFVTWSLQQAGHPMPGTGWAAVQTWVHAAASGEHGLRLVDPDAARPGDLVAFDWGGGNDFTTDGHIGFLDSPVRDLQFTTVEGNSSDAVSRVRRHMGEGNVVFIRVDG